MKLTIVISFLLALHGLLNAEQQSKHLLILSGQSNMAALNPNDSFIPTIEAAFGKNSSIIVKDALGGEPIKRWYKQWEPASAEEPIGDLYLRLLHKVEESTKKHSLASVTFVWMQGERDAREKNGSRYKASLEGLIQQLETDLARKDLNVVIGRLSDFEDRQLPDWNKIRQIQVQVAHTRNNSTWVNTDDLNDGIARNGKHIKNDLHYSANGYQIFGKRLAKACIDLIEQNQAQ